MSKQHGEKEMKYNDQYTNTEKNSVLDCFEYWVERVRKQLKNDSRSSENTPLYKYFGIRVKTFDPEEPKKPKVKLKKLIKTFSPDLHICLEFSGYGEMMIAHVKDLNSSNLFYVQDLKDRKVLAVRPFTEKDREHLLVSFKNADGYNSENTIYVRLYDED